jgi:ribose 5-phosphate isomerase B
MKIAIGSDHAGYLYKQTILQHLVASGDEVEDFGTHSEDYPRFIRLHNDANVLSLGERMMDLPTALRIVETFLTPSFEGGRHLARIQQLDE